jgi:hypothetical protein
MRRTLHKPLRRRSSELKKLDWNSPMQIQPRGLQVEMLAAVAENLSPAMAQSLEKLVSGFLSGVRPDFTMAEIFHLQAAGAALSVVNRTPGSAETIGRQAAYAVSSNPQSAEFAKVLERMPLRLGSR